MNRHVGEALATRFRTSSVETLPTLFAPVFLTDGLFSETFDRSRAALARLDLLHSLDGVLLARETVQYSQNPDMQNTTSAHMQIAILSMPVAAGGDGRAWTLTADGVGFHRGDARSMAEDRLIKQIDESTNISLNLVHRTADNRTSKNESSPPPHLRILPSVLRERLGPTPGRRQGDLRWPTNSPLQLRKVARRK